MEDNKDEMKERFYKACYRSYLVGKCANDSQDSMELSTLYHLSLEEVIAFTCGYLGRVPSQDEFKSVMDTYFSQNNKKPTPSPTHSIMVN